MVDWNRQQVDLTPEDLNAMASKDFTIAREIDESTIESEGRKFKLYSVTVAALDKKRFVFTLFERDLQPITKVIQGSKLADEVGVRLTLGVQDYTKKDKTKTSKIVVVTVQPPAQGALTS
jgi:hypothetical protein